MDAVRPYEHAAAEAPDLLPGFIEEVDRIGLAAETARDDAARAAVGRPHGLAIAGDGDAVGAAPRPPLLRQLRPIADDPIGIGAAIDRRNVGRLRRDLGRHQREHGRSEPASGESGVEHRSLPIVSGPRCTPRALPNRTYSGSSANVHSEPPVGTLSPMARRARMPPR